jgi:membrane fusion protein, multidrug efflux system
MTGNKLLIIGIISVILGAAVASCASATPPAATPMPPATAEVTRTTLVETRTEAGTLSYGDLTPISAIGSGTLTWIAPVESTVDRGEPLYRIDDEPAVVLYGHVPMYRTISWGSEGIDVQQLQENLAELGYSGFTVDGVYTFATVVAVKAWQEDLGLPVTGVVKLGQVIFIPGAVRIAEHTAHIGDVLGGGSTPLLNFTSLDRVVTVRLNVADQSLAAVGETVPISVPGRGIVEGRIAETGTIVTENEIEVTVTIADQRALGPLTAAPVDVDFVSKERKDVLAVPVAALLALAEGGYGVEIVDGNATQIIAVKTGMFAAGRVEVSGEDIAEGMLVGMPR